jgi:hypothetical protein
MEWSVLGTTRWVAEQVPEHNLELERESNKQDHRLLWALARCTSTVAKKIPLPESSVLTRFTSLVFESISRI